MTSQKVGIAIRRAPDVQDALLNYLSEHGPQRPQDVYVPLADLFNLTPEERVQPISPSDKRPGWNNSLQTARNILVKKELINRLPRNLWSLTDSGKRLTFRDIGETKLFVVPDFLWDCTELFIEAPEGRAILRAHLVRERSSMLVETFKNGLSEPTCTTCGFNFYATYGDLGLGYIEAHHVVPVSDLKPGAKTKLDDLIALCSNCHRIIHLNGLLGLFGIERLKQVLGRS